MYWDYQLDIYTQLLHYEESDVSQHVARNLEVQLGNLMLVIVVYWRVQIHNRVQKC